MVGVFLVNLPHYPGKANCHGLVSGPWKGESSQPHLTVVGGVLWSDSRTVSYCYARNIVHLQVCPQVVVCAATSQQLRAFVP